MAKTVFILGAGASQQAGVPLMSGFLDTARDLLDRGRLDSGDATKFDKVFSTISKLSAVFSKSYLDLDNIEEVFGAIEMGWLIQSLGGVPKEEIPEVKEAIQRLIVRTIEITAQFPISGDPLSIQSPSPYGYFFELVKHMREDSNDFPCSILTFNYDIVLDYTFRYFDIYYCLSEKPSNSRLKILKLHGSLNWGWCDKCNEIMSCDLQKYTSNRELYVNRLYKEGIRSTEIPIGTKISKFKHPRCKNPLKGPVLVPPTWNKTEYHTSLSNVWRQAAKELSEAENIFIIGYSFPETDLFFKYLLALGGISETQIRRFWVFNPDRKLEPSYKSLIGRGIEKRFKYHSEVFLEAIRIIQTELSHNS
ncbi:hypothetical protein IIA15_09350 [candidate division TA06 bacterium]|nr:hypothetical protein [candidate division TA06 bacterium]